MNPDIFGDSSMMIMIIIMMRMIVYNCPYRIEIHPFVVIKSTIIGVEGGGGQNQFWQCQDFESNCSPNPSLTKRQMMKDMTYYEKSYQSCLKADC